MTLLAADGSNDVSPELDIMEQTRWSVTVCGVWTMDEHGAPSLREPTKHRGRPNGDVVALDLVAELAFEDGVSHVEVRKQLHAEVRSILPC